MRRVLVVDDEEDIRVIVQLALERVAGWRVTLAASGTEALPLAIEGQHEAVLLDAMMPGMDGTETARRLASHPSTAHIPVLLLTAKVFAWERESLAAGPVVGVLAKPFDPMTLAGDVERALGWS